MKRTPPVHLHYRVPRGKKHAPFHSFMGAWMVLGIIALVVSSVVLSLYFSGGGKEVQLAPGDGSAYSYPGTLTFRGVYENSTYQRGILFGAIALALFIVISLVVVFFFYRREGKEIAQIWNTP